jgi:transposase
MARERIAMSKVIEILRLKFGENRSEREIAQSISVGKSTVHDVIVRATAAGIRWPLQENWSESDARHALFPGLSSTNQGKKPLPDWAYVRKELMKKGVTLHLLWEEYREDYPDGYGLTQFCDYYAKWEKESRLVMRQEHRAGEKTFLDFSGMTVPWLNLETGEIAEAQIFLGVLGASNYTFALAVADQTTESWVECHLAMNTFFGGVSRVWVPDNLKAAVTKACIYDPEINPTYRELARHYLVAVIPARARKPKDKAKVEIGVRIAQMWILARLRKMTFTSIAEINAAIRPLLEVLNNKVMRHLKASRRDLFETIERPALRQLPEAAFELSSWRTAKVGPDYHVEAGRHYYSVPFQLVGKDVEVRMTKSCVEVFYAGKRVAVHRRSTLLYKASALPEHRPKNHRELVEWTPERFVGWAKEHGPHVAIAIETILTRANPHPEDAFRTCFATLRLAKTYSREELDAACEIAIEENIIQLRSIRSILQTGLHKNKTVKKTNIPYTEIHENIRGDQYYH